MSVGTHDRGGAVRFLSPISFAALTAAYIEIRFLRRQCGREFALAEAADLQDHPACGGTTKARCCCGFSSCRCSARWSALFGAESARNRCAPMCSRCRAGSRRRSIFSFWLHPNPFLRRLDVRRSKGSDLNPVLQDIGLAVHPPLLYLGYVGFSISFAFAVAALIEGRIDAAWARWVRPWTLVAWMFLTLGIAMGSYWAYYELGWGGWWFWDPVENASLMPWIAGTALLHSAVVMEKRGALKVWTHAARDPHFSLSLLGTFLVRSGVLTSVHAFATDPTARRVHPDHSHRVHRRQPRVVRLARAAVEAGRLVRAGVARGRARSQQSASDDRVRYRACRHALSDDDRGVDRRQDFRRRAVLQSYRSVRCSSR